MSRYYKHNHMNRKPRFEVKYYREAEEFLQRIEEKTRKKILENVDKARYTLDPKLLKKLTGDVWEFRTLYQGNNIVCSRSGIKETATTHLLSLRTVS